MHLQCLPIKNYGCVGYVDASLPNIVYIAPMALLGVFLHYKVLLRVFLHFMSLLYILSVLCDIFQTIVFFFLLSVSACLLYTK